VGRKRRPEPKKKKSGILMGMRGTVQKAAKAVTGGDKDKHADPADDRAKRRKRIENILWAIAFAAVGVYALWKFGVIRF
jgi:hypothetical protein